MAVVHVESYQSHAMQVVLEAAEELEVAVYVCPGQAEAVPGEVALPWFAESSDLVVSLAHSLAVVGLVVWQYVDL